MEKEVIKVLVVNEVLLGQRYACILYYCKHILFRVNVESKDIQVIKDLLDFKEHLVVKEQKELKLIQDLEDIMAKR